MKAILFIACLLVFSINLLNAQGLEITNKPTTENTLMEDVGFWDAYGKSFVETLLILVVIFIGFVLFKLIIKGYKKLRKSTNSNKSKIKQIKGMIKNYFATMDIKDVIIFSITLGVLVGLCLGYLFGETNYLVKKGLVVSEQYYKERGLTKHLNKYFNFNYITGVASFIITTGVSYLYLSKKGSE